MPNPIVAVFGATIVGGVIQSQAQAKAAKSYGRAADAQSKAIMEMYYQTREDLEPYMEYGGKALESYWDMLETGPGKFEADPGYQFRLGEGEKAIDRASAAKGGFFSGKRGKALVEYGQKFASNEFDKFMGRYYQKMQAHLPVMQLGQASAAKVGAQGLAAVGAGAGIQMGAAGGRASSYLQQGEIWGGATEKIGGELATYYK